MISRITAYKVVGGEQTQRYRAMLHSFGYQCIAGLATDPFGFKCSAINTWALAQLSLSHRRSCCLRFTGITAGPCFAAITAGVALLEAIPRSWLECLPQRAVERLAKMRKIITKYGTVLGEGCGVICI